MEDNICGGQDPIHSYKRHALDTKVSIPEKVRKALRSASVRIKRSTSKFDSFRSTPGNVSPTVSMVKHCQKVMFILDPWTSQILCASKGAAKSFDCERSELQNLSVCEISEGLGAVDWAKAVNKLSSHSQGRSVTVRVRLHGRVASPLGTLYADNTANSLYGSVVNIEIQFYECGRHMDLVALVSQHENVTSSEKSHKMSLAKIFSVWDSFQVDVSSDLIQSSTRFGKEVGPHSSSVEVEASHGSRESMMTLRARMQGLHEEEGGEGRRGFNVNHVLGEMGGAPPVRSSKKLSIGSHTLQKANSANDWGSVHSTETPLRQSKSFPMPGEKDIDVYPLQKVEEAMDSEEEEAADSDSEEESYCSFMKSSSMRVEPGLHSRQLSEIDPGMWPQDPPKPKESRKNGAAKKNRPAATNVANSKIAPTKAGDAEAGSDLGTGTCNTGRNFVSIPGNLKHEGEVDNEGEVECGEFSFRVQDDGVGDAMLDNCERMSMDRANGAEEEQHTLNHWVANPLEGMANMIDLLSHTKLTKEQRNCLDLIGYWTKHLQRVTDSHVDIVLKPESSIGNKEHWVEHNPRKLVTNAVKLLDGRAYEKGIKLKCSIAKDAPRLVLGNKQFLQQAILDDISEAINSTNAGGSIQASLRPATAMEVASLGSGAIESDSFTYLRFQISVTSVGQGQQLSSTGFNHPSINLFGKMGVVKTAPDQSSILNQFFVQVGIPKKESSTDGP